MDFKVFYIIPSLSTGGAEFQTINHVNYLYETGHECALIVLSRIIDNRHLLKLSEDRIHVLNFNPHHTLTKGFFKMLPQVCSKVLKILPKEELHIVAILPAAHVVARIIKVWRGKKVKVHSYFRALDYQNTPLDTLGKKIFNAINSVVARVTDNSSIFISKVVFDDISASFFCRNPLIVANSLEYRKCNVGKANILVKELDVEDFYLILIPGRLHKVKGHKQFLEGFNKFLSENSSKDIRVLIAGEGPERANIERMVSEMGIVRNVIFLGFLEHELLMSLYCYVDLVAIPSLSEGFGNVAIEGLMHGSTMLASDVGGLSEIIRNGENGFLFEKGNHLDLKEKLSFLYKNRDEKLFNREELIKEFKEKYTLERQMRKILDHLLKFEAKEVKKARD